MLYNVNFNRRNTFKIDQNTKVFLAVDTFVYGHRNQMTNNFQ